MKTKALLLIAIHSKGWVCDKLGFSHGTLKDRLSRGNWKKSEIHMLEALYEENKHLI
jgi:hypothetical protein